MLACERHGSGEPLVLVHGLSGRRQVWYPVLEQLSAHREVILVDLPGHGASPDLVTEGRPIIEVLNEALAHFLHEQGLDHPHIAGNSLGGRVALEAGVRGLARSVTALSPAGFWRSEASFVSSRRILLSTAALIERIGAPAERLARTGAGRRLIYGSLMARPGRVSAEHAIGDVRAFHRAFPALRTLLGSAAPFAGDIPAAVPVTIAWAARDLVLPPWQADVARAALPQAEHVRMPGVGHVPMWDDPGQVVRVLLRGSAPVARVARLGPVVGSAVGSGIGRERVARHAESA